MFKWKWMIGILVAFHAANAGETGVLNDSVVIHQPVEETNIKKPSSINFDSDLEKLSQKEPAPKPGPVPQTQRN